MANPRPDRAESEAGDAALIARALAGDATALVEIMRRNNRRLYRAAWGVLRDEQEAEDAVQDCYLKAFAALPTFRGDAALSTWLTRIAINEALMRRRKRQAQAASVGNVVPLRPEESPAPEATEDPALSPESAAMRAQLRPYLEDAIAGLPEDQRAVFVLRALEELSVEETAQVLDLKPETVRTRFLRARRKLQERLQRELKLTFGEMLPFAGARCDRLIQRVLTLFELSKPVPSPDTGEG
ncbi:MAG TPA: RNA polymerase sigma factor [Dongiaceae bacterium]|jgi:RNA polymerase sigma-70 factor (ECF subfamily)|nr:RNA polymerase sigma factor [Dongiaceae bacterium]